MITSHEYEYITGVDGLSSKTATEQDKFECELGGHWFPVDVWTRCFTMAYVKTAKFRRRVTKASGESELQGLTFALTVLDRAILVLPDTFKPGQKVRYTVEVIDP